MASEHSSDWLNARPVLALGLKLDNSTIKIACGLRLGTAFCQPHKFKCGVRTHSDIILKEALGSAHLAAVREPLGLFRMDGKCPDGLTLIPLSRGQSLVWDYTCAYTFASSHLEANSKEAGNAAHKAENKKSRHYANLATSGLFIMPVAVETLGSFAHMGLQFIKDLGKRIIEVIGDKRSTMHLFQRLSIAIQRGNAASLTGTLPSASSLDEFYYL